jgi:hypothetical protein
MHAESCSQANKIPPKKVIGKYRKLLALATRLVDKWPALPQVVKKIRAGEARQEKAAEAGMAYEPPPPPTPPTPQGDAGQPWRTMRSMVESLTGHDPAEAIYRWKQSAHEWALNQLDEAMDAHLDSVLRSGTNAHGAQEWKMLGLDEQLQAEVAIEVEDAETEDGIPLLVIELELPVSVLERIKSAPGGADALLKLLLSVVEEA